MKKVSGGIKLELAQYREMEAFAQFASDLDASTRQVLERGARLTELLKQDQYSPLAMEQQVCLIYAGTKGYVDQVAVADVRRYEAQLLQALDTKGAGVLSAIRDSGKLDDATEDQLKALLDDFTGTFA